MTVWDSYVGCFNHGWIARGIRAVNRLFCEILNCDRHALVVDLFVFLLWKRSNCQKNSYFPMKISVIQSDLIISLLKKVRTGKALFSQSRIEFCYKRKKMANNVCTLNLHQKKKMYEDRELNKNWFQFARVFIKNMHSIQRTHRCEFSWFRDVIVGKIRC